jgi:hypothetical protein
MDNEKLVEKQGSGLRELNVFLPELHAAARS